jgi:hypothetical protein
MTVLSLGYLLLERTGDYLLEQLDSELTSEAKGAIFILSNPDYKISFGYLTNKLGGEYLINERAQSLINATYKILTG